MAEMPKPVWKSSSFLVYTGGLLERIAKRLLGRPYDTTVVQQGGVCL